MRQEATSSCSRAGLGAVHQANDVDEHQHQVPRSHPHMTPRKRSGSDFVRCGQRQEHGYGADAAAVPGRSTKAATGTNCGEYITAA